MITNLLLEVNHRLIFYHALPKITPSRFTIICGAGNSANKRSKQHTSVGIAVPLSVDKYS